MKYTLRQATEADYEFCFQLVALSLRQAIEATWGWDETWQRDYFSHKFDPTKRQIIQISGEDAGALVIEQRPDEIYLALIALLPAFQRYGIGSVIIRQMQADARELNLPLCLHVLKTNEDGRRFYERLDSLLSQKKNSATK